MCSESIQPVTIGEDGRFSITKSQQHTDWVKVRFIVDTNGHVNDPKPIEHSSDLYINRAHKRVKQLTFIKPDELCYKDLVLYQTLNK